jgi:hypothetical protein
LTITFTHPAWLLWLNSRNQSSPSSDFSRGYS